jgi:hypothetical protein
VKPKIYKDRRGGDWLFSHPGAPTVPLAIVMYHRHPTWADAMRACDLWYVTCDLFEAVAAAREDEA